jgi:hypothetical protein
MDRVGGKMVIAGAGFSRAGMAALVGAGLSRPGGRPPEGGLYSLTFERQPETPVTVRERW